MGVEVARFEMASPEDAEDLARVLRGLNCASIRRIAVIGKCEGPATINDFSRALAVRAVTDCMAKANISADAPREILFSTGCEGVITPGGFVLVESSACEGIAGLALGLARSEPLTPEQTIASAHIHAAAHVTAAAIADAGLESVDVGLVLMKSPVLTHADAAGGADRRARVNSTALARGVGALGAALALGEIDADVDEGGIGDETLHARRAMVFSGTETRRCEAVVLGNRPGSLRPLRYGLVSDLLDIEGMAAVLAPDSKTPLESAMRMGREGRIVAAFFKAGLASNGRLRGSRTTVYSSDLDHDKHLRAAASGVLGALLGETRVFISGGAEHQAPPGGCIFAAIIAE